MGEILLLAVASAFYPMYLAVVVIACATAHPAKVLLPYWLAGMATTIVIGLVLVLALDGSSLTLSQRSPISPALDITIGAGIVVGALFLRRWSPPAPDPKQPSRTEHMLAGGPYLAAAAGVLMNVVPGPGYVLGLKDIAVGGYTVAGEIALIVGFCLVQLSLVGLPVIGNALAPERTADLARRFNAWLRRNGVKVLAAAAAALGVYLVARGIYLLAT